MALPDWIPAAGVLSGVAGMLIAALRVRPEARKFDAEGSASLITSSSAMATAVHSENVDLRAQVKDLMTWRQNLENRWRRHARWDNQLVILARAAGIPVTDPPALYDDDDEPGEVPAPRGA